MPSFDVVNELNLQEIDNAVNITKKTIATRYDFKDSQTEIDFDKKEKKITVTTEDTMKLDAVKDTLAGNLIKRGVSVKALDYQEPEPSSKGGVRIVVKLKEGLDKDTARQVVKLIKDQGLKVQAQIQDEQVRVTAKQIDDLQKVIALLKQQDLPVPLQYVNMKR